MSINNNIDTVLSALGWHDGFRIPVANEENIRLEEEIEKKMKFKEDLTTKLETIKDRVAMMKKHASYLTTEHDMNQKLLNVHSTQLESEDHHYRLSCSTESSLRREARDFEKEWKTVNETISNVKRELEKMTKKIEASKKAVKYDEKSLREWEETLNQNEDNNQLIEQYMKEDLKEYKEQELKRQKLNTELQTYREAIVKTSNEAREMEIVLDRTTKLYDQALTEYRQMFNQWKESVVMMQQKNEDIKRTLQEIETSREITQGKRNVLQESEKFLKEQTENNKEAEELIKKLEKDLFNMKEEQRKKKEMLGVYENQLIIQKNIAKDSSQRVQQVRADIKRKRSEIQGKYVKVEKISKQVTDLADKLQNIDSQKLNIEEKAKELENMIEEQERKKAAMMKEVNRLQTANLRVVNQIKELENEDKILKMQCQNESKKIEYTDKLYSKNEKILEEKTDSLYQVQFELQKSELKLERLKGYERDKSEAERKQRRIEELQSVLNDKMEVSKLLQKQTASLEYDMRKMTNSLASDNNELEYLRNKRQDLVLLMDAGEKQLKSAQNLYEEKQVEESLLRLKLLQMEKMISNLGNNVYDLERYRLELEAAIRERKAEIAVQKESLTIQKRVATSECSDLRCSISERGMRMKQLQARYDSGLAALGTNLDGTPVNTTHLKIQNAQERYLLQEQGDKLDETIRRTEHEIQAMENTLRVVNACNDKYKITLTADDKYKSEVEEHRKLDEELSSTEQNLKEKREELHSSTEDLQKLQSDYARVLKTIEETKELKENKNQILIELKQQIHDQNEKLLRADRNLKSAQKDIKKIFAARGDHVVIVQQKEVELREIQEQNSIVLQDIAEFTIHHVEAESYVKKLLAVKNIELPSLSLFNQSPISSQRCSITNSVECLLKSTTRGSTVASSRESIRNIVNLEPEFGTTAAKYSSKRSTRLEKQSVKSSLHLQTKKNI
ncbi:coiled-coil domain-containing protein 39-like [Andrena cerasifolii]|uniref:coiled-coil domain-containing protein 39-like n=1 Tax=Andrena cerasifolii TaxID=2819439 RepID=UPI00403846C5